MMMRAMEERPRAQGGLVRTERKERPCGPGGGEGAGQASSRAERTGHAGPGGGEWAGVGLLQSKEDRTCCPGGGERAGAAPGLLDSRAGFSTGSSPPLQNSC